MKKIKLLALLFTSLMAVVPSTTAISASAEQDFSLGQGGADIIYNSEPTGGDYAWVKVAKDYSLTTNGTYRKVDTSYVIIGFDAPEIESIVRMGFYVNYRDPNFIQDIGNWWEILWGNQPKYGEIKTDTSLVQASTVYSFMDKQNIYGVTDSLSSRYSFKAIGRVEELLLAETNYRTEIVKPNTMSGPNKVDYSILPGYGITGGYFYNYNYTDKLNDSSKSFTNRTYYAVVPYRWTEEIQPESIKAFSFDGELIDDGLDDSGKAYIDPVTGYYYIDVKVSKNAGVSVNGTNAVVRKIEVTGYTTGNDTAIMLDNGDFDYQTQTVVPSVNRRLVIGNETFNPNWGISNDNRYIFVKYAAEDMDLAKQITVRIYYTNSNEKSAWLINVKGELGFLPPPYITPPVVRPVENDLAKLIQIVLFAFIGILIFGLLFFIINFISKIRDIIR